MSKKLVLIIDDNPDIGIALKVLCTIHNLDCMSALSPETGLDLLKQHDFDLVIQDMNFIADTTSGHEGVTLFHQIRDIVSDMPIILITAWTHLETAIDLVRSGAADYLAKPWDDDKLINSINNLLEIAELQSCSRRLATKKQRRIELLKQNYDLCDMQFASDEMLSLLELGTKVAHADVPVLITGPNGAGKEKIAQIIQANSRCKQGAFVKVNVGALAKDLIEAELFGAEPGAYTGITKTRIGRFERADKGTLFLDEIGNLSLDGQTKLLRVLETGEFERLGGSETLHTKVRIISATNSDLPQAIADGQFREDLYYRLNVIELKLAALAQRVEDIVPLALYFLNGEFELSSQAAQKLNLYTWPGNVRELQNIIKRAMLITDGAIISQDDIDIPVELIEHIEHKQNVEEATKPEIIEALALCGGVVSMAAKSLGLSRSALYRRMKKFEIAS